VPTPLIPVTDWPEGQFWSRPVPVLAAQTFPEQLFEQH
jgi:hypothetical protein